MPEQGDDGRFQKSATVNEVMDVFDAVDGPVISSSDVTDHLPISGDTARRRLETLSERGRIEGRQTAGRKVWWLSGDEKGKFSVDETRAPPNERLTKRLEHLREITPSTVKVACNGGSVYMLRGRDNEMWTEVFQALRDHNYEIQKLLDGTLYVEKGPDRRR